MMTTKRWTIGLVLLLLASGCSDEASDAGSEPPAAEATTTRAPTTTDGTLPPTTTTTTTTVPPWTTIPVPDWPEASLTGAFGGPLTIETMCVDLALPGFDPDANALDDVVWTFEQMGIEVVADGCDVAVDIDIAGTRTSARYKEKDGGGGTETCWAGQFAEGEVRFRIGDSVVGVGKVDIGDPPPDSVNGCAGKDSPVRAEYWAGPVADAMLDALGAPAGVVFPALLQTRQGSTERAQRLRETPGIGGIYAAALNHAAALVRETASRSLMDWASDAREDGPPFPEELWATIPHLIACGAREGFTEHSGCDTVDPALVHLLFGVVPIGNDFFPDGFDRDDPADWWDLWEQQSAMATSG